MTNSVTILEKGNEGDHNYVIAEIDITSLGADGVETFDAESTFSLSPVYGGTVIERENPEIQFDYEASNNDILVGKQGPTMNQRSVDPESQQYDANTQTILASYGNTRPGGGLIPLNFNPADPADAALQVELQANYRDSTNTDIIQVTDGTEQTFENILDGFPTGDDQKQIKGLQVIVQNTSGSNVTEDIGATTTEFLSWNNGVASGTDVGWVRIKVTGDFSA